MGELSSIFILCEVPKTCYLLSTEFRSLIYSIDIGEVNWENILGEKAYNIPFYVFFFFSVNIFYYSSSIFINIDPYYNTAYPKGNVLKLLQSKCIC